MTLDVSEQQVKEVWSLNVVNRRVREIDMKVEILEEWQRDAVIHFWEMGNAHGANWQCHTELEARVNQSLALG